MRLLRQACMIGMIMRRQQIGDFLELDTAALALMQQFGKCAWKPDVDKQARDTIREHVIIGRVVANVDNVHAGYDSMEWAER